MFLLSNKNFISYIQNKTNCSHLFQNSESTAIHNVKERLIGMVPLSFDTHLPDNIGTFDIDLQYEVCGFAPYREVLWPTEAEDWFAPQKDYVRHFKRVVVDIETFLREEGIDIIGIELQFQTNHAKTHSQRAVVVKVLPRTVATWNKLGAVTSECLIELNELKCGPKLEVEFFPDYEADRLRVAKPALLDLLSQQGGCLRRLGISFTSPDRGFVVDDHTVLIKLS